MNLSATPVCRCSVYEKNARCQDSGSLPNTAALADAWVELVREDDGEGSGFNNLTANVEGRPATWMGTRLLSKSARSELHS